VSTVPSPDRRDELLADPPRGDWHLGRFAGYRAAARVRKRMTIVLGAAGLAAIVAYWRYTAWLEYERTHPFELPAGADLGDRPREMTWSGGKARVGLAREAPGLSTLHLPDRDIFLADGCDRAQLKLEVEGGKTVRLEVLSGEIEQVLHDPRPDQ
jgi:hypothetical protein